MYSFALLPSFAFVRTFASTGSNYLAVSPIVFSSYPNQTGLSGNSYVSKLIDDHREASLAQVNSLPPHIGKIISDDILFEIVKTFITKFVFDKSWKVQTFERESANCIKHIFGALLSVDPSFRLPKGGNAPFMHKVIRDLSVKLLDV